MLTSLFSSFYVTGEFHRFLHRGRATFFTSKVNTKCHTASLFIYKVKSQAIIGMCHLSRQFAQARLLQSLVQLHLTDNACLSG